MARDFGVVSRFVDRLVETGRVAGAGMAIAIDGKPAFQYLAGEARPGQAATAETIWPVASISKLFTSAAVMTLIEAGELAFSTKASAILPDFQGNGREKITLRQLLTHTSGLPHEPPNLEALFQANADLEQFVAHVYTDPLLFEPGMGQAYSDSGMALAGLMGAKVAGVSFPELVSQRVIEPAGLQETYMPPPLDLLDRIAYITGAPFEGTDWDHYNSPYGIRTAHPSYGAVATLPDLLRFILLFDPNATQHIHSAAALATMTTDQTHGYEIGATAPRPDGIIPQWGAGFMIKGASGECGLASPESYGHMGATGCIAWADPRSRVSLAFVSNSHIRRGYDELLSRLEEAVNVVLSSATRSG